MTVSQAILASINNTGGGGGGGSKYAAWNGIDWDPMNEGQTNTFTVTYDNWDGSTIYWNIVGVGDNPASSADFDVASGSTTPDAQTGGLLYFNFTATADAAIEGPQTYIITVGSTDGGTDYADGSQGTYTIRDTSQNPQMILNLDPATYDAQGYPTSLTDQSTLHNDAVLHNLGGFDSVDGGGSFVFDGTSTYVGVPNFDAAWKFPYLTASIWFKEDVNAPGATRTLISKELSFKLRITQEGFVQILANSKTWAPWDSTFTANGSEHLRHGQWNNLTITQTDQDAGWVYLNGVKFMSFSGGLLSATTFPFVIGGYADNAGVNDYFAGSIAQVRMWNYARTEEQVWNDFVTDVNRYIPQCPAFDLQWNDTHNAFYDPDQTSLSVTINSATAYPENNGPLASGLVWPGTSGDFIDIEGVNYIESAFTLSVVAKFNINPSHYNTVFDGSALDRITNGIWANVWSDQFSVGLDVENYGLNDMTSYPNDQVAWWDFVFTRSDVTLYKNGLQVGTHSMANPNDRAYRPVWYDNLRIAAEYNQTGNNMAGVYYRFKYQKTALSATDIIIQYNANCGLYDLPPVQYSLVFTGRPDLYNQPGTGVLSYLEVAGNAGDWALGNTYTIEWWEKPDTTDWGTIMSASDSSNYSNYGVIDIQSFNYNVYPNRQGWGAGQIPPGMWGHFAIVVTDNNTHKMYVNGVQMYTNNFPTYVLTDMYANLRIGRSITDIYPQYRGKLTGIRISDKVLYTSNFIPEIIPQKRGETKLLLNADSGFTDWSDYYYGGAQVTTTSTEAGGITYLKFAKNAYGQAYDPSGLYTNFVDFVNVGDRVQDANNGNNMSYVVAPVFDDGTYIVVPVYTIWYTGTTGGGTTAVTFTRDPRHVSKINVGISLELPKQFTNWPVPVGGSRGIIPWQYGDPYLTEFQSVPVGAAVTSNITGFGIRTVTQSSATAYGWVIVYDATGLTGLNTSLDRFNFYW